MALRWWNPLRCAAGQQRSAPTQALNPRRALQVLGITYTSGLSAGDVKKAYTRQSLKCHPDISASPDAKEQFQLLTEALRVAIQAVRQATPFAASKDDAAKPAPTTEDALRGALDEHLRAKRRFDGSGGGWQNENDDRDAFYTPTIDDVTRVCQQEAKSMRQIQRFCNELPATLCGHQRMLFDCVGSADPHCVAPLADSMERFAKHLPLLVRRVVKLREKFAGRRRPTGKKIVKGFGSTSGAVVGDENAGKGRGDHIEDMPLKPLVLIGALVFTDNRAAASSTTGQQGSNDEGAAAVAGVKCTKELTCVLHITDSIDDIAAKMSAWELASFHRLRLELSISSTASLFFSLLELPDQVQKPLMSLRRGVVSLSTLETSHARSGVSFHVPPTLLITLDEMERVGLTVQRLSCLLCQVGGTDDALGTAQREAAAILSGLRRLCQEKSVLSRIEGQITLVWDVADPKALVASPESVVGPDEVSSDIETGTPQFAVRRHPRCCSADAVQFAVSIRLTTSLVVFLQRLWMALSEVARKSAAADAAIPKIQQIQQDMRRDEFIPVQQRNNEMPTHPAGSRDNTIPSSIVSASVAADQRQVEAGNHLLSEPQSRSGTGPSRFVQHRFEFMRDEFQPPTDDGETSFVHRPGIRCVSRVCNMEQTVELVLWERLFEEREFLAGRVGVLSAGLNIFYECLPYGPSNMPATVPADDVLGQWPLRPIDDDAGPGWVGDGEDGDLANISQYELSSPRAFRAWLERVVSACSLANEARILLAQSGIGYVVREPHLPPQQFLSFVRLFCASTAARSTLEGRARGGTGSQSAGFVVSSAALGFTIHIGTECDVRNGGNWVIPWNVDPALLVSLLAPLSSPPGLCE